MALSVTMRAKLLGRKAQIQAKKSRLGSSRAFNVQRITNEAWTEWVPLKSSQLDTTRYNPDLKQLVISFKSGGSYLYQNVPFHVWDTLLSAPSPGSYFSKFIKPTYIASKV